MIIVNKIQDVREHVKAWRTEGQRVGFVPTMGYLHEGHQSLIKRASEENDYVVVSIFVNPMQFGEKEDFENYPVNLERDSQLCEMAGADIIFQPDAKEIYHNGFSTYVDMNGLTDSLCGKSRPGHFRGVCTVVLKLFHIVNPDRAYFGKKDAQQLAVIHQMVNDLNMDIEIVGCETIREEDGLAKSSRNVRLSPEERNTAVILPKALSLAQRMIAGGNRNPKVIIAAVETLIQAEISVTLDYVEIVDAANLEPVLRIESSVLVAVAVFIGNIRLIDNFIYDIENNSF